MKYIKKILQENKLLMVVVFVSLVLRFGTVFRLLSFTPDEAYQTYLAQTIIKNFHIIWIGLSAGSFGLYFGPFWIYIISPFLSIAHGDPLVLGYLSSAIGVAATFLIYFLGKEMFGKKVGLIASLLYACLPLAIYYDQKPYPTGMSFLALAMIFALYKTKDSKWWWVVFSTLYGSIFHIHLSLMPMGFVGAYWLYSHKKSIDRKKFLFSVLAFVLMISPLIAFDYFHKGSNISAPIRLLQSAKGKGVHPDFSYFPYHLNNLIDSLGRIWYIAPYKNSQDEILWPCSFAQITTRTKPLILFSIATLLFVVIWGLRKKTWRDENRKLLYISGLSFIIPFLVLAVMNPIEYYLVGFFPILFLMTAVSIESLPKRIKEVCYLIVLVICALGVFTVVTASGDYGLRAKKNLINDVMGVVGNRPFDLNEDGGCHKYEAWRYLFSVYERIPEQSDEDPVYGWLYPTELSKRKADFNIVLSETRARTPMSGYKYSFIEGGFTAYIYELKK